ncbi:MAG TPA: winged helix-turn-helix domain-containing protein [Pseudomonas sp.]|nr:winged helix-turn-helix domain-containing protein [Pseudomonas sp.]
MSIYVINQQIHFDSETYLLYAATTPAEVLRIGAIASRCLTLLLQADGQIVSKRDLMNGAWGSFGLEVTENSLAQVVRQLRVALEKLNGNPELIATVPRIGYRITEAVTLLDNSSAPPQTPPPAIEPEYPAVAPAIIAAPQHHWPARLLLGLAAIACWVVLFLLPGLLNLAQPTNLPFAESRVELIDGVSVHLEDMPASALQPDNRQLVARARQLGQAIGIDSPNLHIYRFADSYRSLDLLCEGLLLAANSQCLGLQPNE